MKFFSEQRLPLALSVRNSGKGNDMLEEKNISVGGAGSAPERGTSEELPDAQTLLRAFVREKLDGDLRNFREFDFEALKGDERFGCADPRKFDGDNTFIIRAVYVLLFGKAFPDMTDWRGIGSGMRYRGDTIHTFHTVFGRADPDRPGHFFGIDRFAPSATSSTNASATFAARYAISAIMWSCPMSPSRKMTASSP